MRKAEAIVERNIGNCREEEGRQCTFLSALRPGFGSHKTLVPLLSEELETRSGDIRLRALSTNPLDPRPSEVHLYLLKALDTIIKRNMLGLKNTENRSHSALGKAWLHG